MKVKNLTDKTQKFDVKKLVGDDTEFSIYLQAKGTTSLDKSLKIIEPTKYAGILDIEGIDMKAVDSKKLVETTIIEENDRVDSDDSQEESTEVETTIIEENEKVEETKTSAFICDVCGSEFASARGLANHKNKAHAE